MIKIQKNKIMTRLKCSVLNGFCFCSPDTSSPIITPKVEREEPEKIKKWREEQKTRLEEKGNAL